MKMLLGWMLVMIMVGLVVIGCQDSTNPTGPTDRPVPAQYQTLHVPIITTVP